MVNVAYRRCPPGVTTVLLAEAIGQLVIGGVTGDKAMIPLAATFTDGHYVQRVIDACHLSNELGTWVDV